MLHHGALPSAGAKSVQGPEVQDEAAVDGVHENRRQDPRRLKVAGFSDRQLLELSPARLPTFSRG